MSDSEDDRTAQESFFAMLQSLNLGAGGLVDETDSDSDSPPPPLEEINIALPPIEDQFAGMPPLTQYSDSEDEEDEDADENEYEDEDAEGDYETESATSDDDPLPTVDWQAVGLSTSPRNAPLHSNPGSISSNGDMPRLLSVSDSDSEESDLHDSDSDFGVAAAAARYAVERRRPSPGPIPPPTGFQPDIRRSKLLIEGLELVTPQWLTRYKAIQGGAEDAVICAVCHDSLVEEQAESSTSHQEAITVHVLPCKHLFHTPCLSPWLGLKSTCPTCRFDLDPDALTARHEEPSASHTEMEMMLRMLGSAYWASPFQPNTTTPRDDDEDRDDVWDEHMPALEPATVGSPQSDVSDHRILPEEVRNELRSRIPQSLLTPESSRAATLDTPGEPLPFDQMRWPPNRSGSVEFSNVPLPNSSTEGLREALFLRRMRVDGAPQASVTTSTRSQASSLRASTLPELAELHEEEPQSSLTNRRSTTSFASTSYQPISPTFSPMSATYSPASSTSSPEIRSMESPPVAPLLGVLNALPPVSPVQHSETQQVLTPDDPDFGFGYEEYSDHFSALTGGAVGNGDRVINLNSPHPGSPLATYVAIPPTPRMAHRDLPISPATSRRNPTASVNALLQTLRRNADQIPRHNGGFQHESSVPDSFTFGSNSQDDSDDESVDEQRPKWAPPPAQSFCQWIEEREAVLANRSELNMSIDLTTSPTPEFTESH